jgi:hypothetical protein
MKFFGYFGKWYPYIPSGPDLSRAKGYNLYFENNSWHWQHRKWPYIRSGVLEYKLGQVRKLNTTDINKSIETAGRYNRERDQLEQKLKEEARRLGEKKKKDDTQKAEEDRKRKERDEQNRKNKAAQQRAAAIAAAKAKAAADEKAAIKSRVVSLQKAVAQKKKQREGKISALKEKHRKQAAYGRDVVRKRAKREGYVTESEKLMGGRSGYYAIVKPKAKPEPEPEPEEKPGAKPALSGFGMTRFEIQAATNAVKRAAENVKQVTKDVKTGVATKAELEAAIAELEATTRAAKAFDGWPSSNFGGFGMTRFEIQAATNAVKKAAKNVKLVTKDVKAGVATKADLETAIAELEATTRAAKAFDGWPSDGLGGLGDFGEGGGGTIGTLIYLALSACNGYHGYIRNGKSVGWGMAWFIFAGGPIGLIISLIQGWGQPSDSVRLRQLETRMRPGGYKKSKKKAKKRKKK